MDSAQVGEEKDLIAEHQDKLKPIEKLVRQFLERDSSAKFDLWEFQRRLLHLQIESLKDKTQANKQIAELNSAIRGTATKRPSRWKDKLRGLQSGLLACKRSLATSHHRYEIARRLGDAYAWLLLSMTPNGVEGIEYRVRNPPPPDSETCGLMMKMAAYFGSAELGFPIINDVSNILTTGDITFVRPDRNPITVELKMTHRQRCEEKLRVSVAMHSIVNSEERVILNRRLDQLRSQIEKFGESQDRCLPSKPSDPRLKRQMDRLKDIVDNQGRENGSVSFRGKEPSIFLKFLGNSNHHNYEALRRIVAAAEETGYGFESIDNTFFYAAVKNETPIVYPWPQEVAWRPPPRMLSDLTNSGIFLKNRDENALALGLVNEQLTGRGPKHVFPLFLLPIPIDSIVDMIYDRLFLFVMFNPGVIAQSLRALGIKSWIRDPRRCSSSDYMNVESEFDDVNGDRWRAQLKGLRYIADPLMYEYLSRSAFLERIKTMLKAGIDGHESVTKEKSQHGGTQA